MMRWDEKVARAWQRFAHGLGLAWVRRRYPPVARLEDIPAAFDVDVPLGRPPVASCTVLFTVAPDAVSPYHIVLMVHVKGMTVLVNPATRAAVYPVADPERVIRSLAPRWRVEAPLVRLREDELIAGPNEPLSCVTVARAILGINNMLIQTPEQLVDYLWRHRHGLYGLC